MYNYGNNENTKTFDLLRQKNAVRKQPKPNKNGIINFYDVIPKKFLDDVDNPNFNLHHLEIPFRACVVAPSGSGKTNFVVNLIKLFSQGKGTFADITIVTRNKDEPLYNWLAMQSDQIKIVEGMKNNPKLDDFDKKQNHLIIWDDLVLSKKLDDVSEYYIRARKKNVSLLFLSQSYVDIPKIIRKNSSYLILLDLGGSKRERDFILREWASDLEKEQLSAIYTDAVSDKFTPLIIKGGKVNENEKYRKGFTNFYNVKQFLQSKGLANMKKTKKKELKNYDDYSDDSEEEYI